jgi:hypothetical protein
MYLGFMVVLLHFACIILKKQQSFLYLSARGKSMNDSLEQFGDAFFMISVVCVKERNQIFIGFLENAVGSKTEFTLQM